MAISARLAKASDHSMMIGIASSFIWIMVFMPASVQSIGVCYGRSGSNLPSAGDVVNLYKSNGISSMRIYSPDSDVLQALRDSGIQLIVNVGRDDLQSIAGDASAANSWVQNNVVNYWPSVSFRYIAVGNEEIPGSLAQYVLPAMNNIQNALSAAGLSNDIKVSTAVSTAVVGSSFPPSDGVFSGDGGYMGPIVQFLASHGAPLLVNVYPYFSFVDNQDSISLDYARFTSPAIVVTDNNNGLGYQNLFDAITDSVVAALEKAGGSGVAVVVSESGWPSAGGTGASADNAQTYNQNLIRHVGGGTPKRPGNLETYIFEMFNENQKGGGEVEQNFGLFFPNQQAVYSISF